MITATSRENITGSPAARAIDLVKTYGKGDAEVRTETTLTPVTGIVSGVLCAGIGACHADDVDNANFHRHDRPGETRSQVELRRAWARAVRRMVAAALLEDSPAGHAAGGTP